MPKSRTAVLVPHASRGTYSNPTLRLKVNATEKSEKFFSYFQSIGRSHVCVLEQQFFFSSLSLLCFILFEAFFRSFVSCALFFGEQKIYSVGLLLFFIWVFFSKFFFPYSNELWIKQQNNKKEKKTKNERKINFSCFVILMRCVGECEKCVGFTAARPQHMEWCEHVH